MVFLINSSKEKAGGGLQVTDSICRTLNNHPNHIFIVVVSEKLVDTYNNIKRYKNVYAFVHTFQDSLYTFVSGRYPYLDDLVDKYHVNAVLTVFGPSRWAPRVPHLCGFARAQLVMSESPYFKNMGIIHKMRESFYNWLVKLYFNPSKEKFFYSENEIISIRVEALFPNSKCYTITNCYNQIFDCPEKWKIHQLPKFEGFSFLTVSTHYPHKNLEISIDIAKYLRTKYPDFKFRFVFTINDKSFDNIPEELWGCFCFIGPVDISECPSLYNQCDIAFQPSLLECFTATYPEAMRMGLPIVTTDMDFAKALCGDAACYYSAMNAEEASEAIYKVASDKTFSQQLVANGKKQLMIFDNYVQRSEKIIKILEKISNY